MKSRARKTPTPRKWTTETAYTGRVCARIPLELRDRLRRYVDGTMLTTTEVIIDALDGYLKTRGY